MIVSNYILLDENTFSLPIHRNYPIIYHRMRIEKLFVLCARQHLM